MAETRPISFRVSNEILDAIEAEGKSATDIARKALEREARLARARKALTRIVEHPLPGRFEGDVTQTLRRERDAR